MMFSCCEDARGHSAAPRRSRPHSQHQSRAGPTERGRGERSVTRDHAPVEPVGGSLRGEVCPYQAIRMSHEWIQF
ncbi:hypothetical protein DNTS_014783 [Danionella cerebrum]|uniref:Uncharacterized protein n=1 Tax=Danionella cerebrum TaxID=2873325 RepID=A0A553RJ24_9TELE|nr:hypothetical protein DNTS_014596 [Danionella translucida]TRZ02171.1 hypothetical protein DNTS_014783 [Danionella translucida]